MSTEDADNVISRLRQPVHPSITEEQVSHLVDVFYETVHGDERLGPIFASQMNSSWPAHLETMKAFWRSVLLKTGEYKGRPVPAHARLTDVTTEDFQQWLQIFAATTARVFAPDARTIVLETAKRIASSLWLARAGDPFAAPPVWRANFEEGSAVE